MKVFSKKYHSLISIIGAINTNLRIFFEKHFVVFTPRNRPNIPGRISYGKISIWPKTFIGFVLMVFFIFLLTVLSVSVIALHSTCHF
jgi:hypothetical protein